MDSRAAAVLWEAEEQQRQMLTRLVYNGSRRRSGSAWRNETLLNAIANVKSRRRLTHTGCNSASKQSATSARKKLRLQRSGASRVIIGLGR